MFEVDKAVSGNSGSFRNYANVLVATIAGGIGYRLCRELRVPYRLLGTALCGFAAIGALTVCREAGLLP